ncbi:MAG: hypothetical protein GY805_34620 [Chloroflexi bacterium]|nr:hypothetical protein [Chloroflexota bacterium]
MLKRTTFWRTVWLLIILAAVSGLPKSVAAHAFLERSDPADNAILTESPDKFHLWFSEPLSPDFSSAQVLDTEGSVVVLQGIMISADNPRLMILDMPPELPEGAYSILWKVLSTSDGHFTQGLVVFGVGSSANLANAASVKTETAVPKPEVGLRWLNFVTLMSVVGALVIVSLVLDITNYPLILASIQSIARQRILQFAMWVAALSLFVGFGWLVWQAIAITNTLPEGTAVWTTGWQWLSRTRLGIFWLAKQSILLGIFMLLYRSNKFALIATWQKITLFILVVAVVVVQSLTSHSAALLETTALAIVVDALHFIAASIWVGGLLSINVGFMPFLRHRQVDFKLLMKAGWWPFGRVAIIAVMVLIATGLYSTGRQVASIDALISTAYGQALSIKVLLMLFVGFIGLLNAILLHPRLAIPIARIMRRPTGWTPVSFKHLPRLILLEMTLGIFLILITGYITAAPTARGPQFLPSTEISTSQIQQIGDVLVNLSIKPNKPGANVFTIRATNIRRPPLAEIERVIVRLTYQDQDFGMISVDAQEVDPGIYRIGGNDLNLAGNWQVDVVVRRLGLADNIATFDWIVAAGGEPQNSIVSNQDWQPYLSAAAIGMLLLMLVGLAILVPRRMNPVTSGHVDVENAKRKSSRWRDFLQRE